MFFCSLQTWSASPNKPDILVSVNPLYLAIQEAFGEIVNSERLLSPGVSPHNYALKPSEALKLRQADLVVWIGKDLENFLDKPLKQREALGKTSFSAMDYLIHHQIPGLLKINEVRRIADYPHNDDHAHQSQDSHHPHHSHQSAMYDPHLWFSRKLIISIIRGLSDTLSKRYPDLAITLEKAERQFSEKLLSETIQEEDFNIRKFISYHNSFDYLSRENGIDIIDVITTNTDLRPGASQVIAIKELLDGENTCLITEPQFKGGIVEKILHYNPDKMIEIDPLGSEFTSYSEFYVGTLNKLKACRE